MHETRPKICQCCMSILMKTYNMAKPKAVKNSPKSVIISNTADHISDCVYFYWLPYQQ